MSDLIMLTDKWLGKTNNLFRVLPVQDRNYIDALAAIRNCVVHESDAAIAAYKTKLRTVYNIHSAPKPEEFLYAKDYRAGSPARYQPRIQGLAVVLGRSILNT